MKNITIEICAGSVRDCVVANQLGVKRVELNSALYLGGLTPSTSMLEMVRARCPELKICSMVRPRGAGFCYTDLEYEQMTLDAKELIAHGSDGIVFGILKDDFTMDIDRLKPLVAIAHDAGKEAIVHRAFDCVKNQDKAMESLIKLGVDRVLTSGGAPNAHLGVDSLAHLQSTYGNDIEILAGAGIRPQNAKEIIEKTGVTQIHSSCGMWFEDTTTSNGIVSYGYNSEYPLGYEGCDEETINLLLEAISI